jgi:hypothetical protein
MERGADLMAVPSNLCFTYEATLSADAEGSYSGVATSLQALRGGPPGLAGGQPTIRVSGGRIRVESDARHRPPPPWTEWLVFWSGGLANRWVERRFRSARVRAFELEVPGMVTVLRDGAVLRLAREIIAGPGTLYEDKLTIVLRDEDGELGAWSPQRSIHEEPW